MKRYKTILNIAIACAIALPTMAQAKTVPGISEQPQSYFYTGKPYDRDTGEYTFAYRRYDPKTTRWSSSDPSGFPDGSNCYKYLNAPTSDLDALGLWSSAEFLEHYFTGKLPYTIGQTVDLGVIGNGSDIRTFTSANEALYKPAVDLAAYYASYNKLSSFTGGGTTTVNINYQPVCFA